MKKLLTIILLALCVSVLCGCAEARDVKVGQEWKLRLSPSTIIEIVKVEDNCIMYAFEDMPHETNYLHMSSIDEFDPGRIWEPVVEYKTSKYSNSFMITSKRFIEYQTVYIDSKKILTILKDGTVIHHVNRISRMCSFCCGLAEGECVRDE